MEISCFFLANTIQREGEERQCKTRLPACVVLLQHPRQAAFEAQRSSWSSPLCYPATKRIGL